MVRLARLPNTVGIVPSRLFCEMSSSTVKSLTAARVNGMTSRAHDFHAIKRQSPALPKLVAQAISDGIVPDKVLLARRSSPDKRVDKF